VFSSTAAYASVNAVTAAMASESVGSRSTEAMRSVIVSVTSADAAVAVARHAVIADFKQLSRMSRGSFPNFGNTVNPTGKGLLGPIIPSRPNAEPSPEIDE